MGHYQLLFTYTNFVWVFYFCTTTYFLLVEYSSFKKTRVFKECLVHFNKLNFFFKFFFLISCVCFWIPNRLLVKKLPPGITSLFFIFTLFYSSVVDFGMVIFSYIHFNLIIASFVFCSLFEFNKNFRKSVSNLYFSRYTFSAGRLVDYVFGNPSQRSMQKIVEYGALLISPYALSKFSAYYVKQSREAERFAMEKTTFQKQNLSFQSRRTERS